MQQVDKEKKLSCSTHLALTLHKLGCGWAKLANKIAVLRKLLHKNQ